MNFSISVETSASAQKMCASSCAEAPHACQAVHDAAALVAVQPPEVGHAPRQLAVAPPLAAEDHAVARAVHRLDGERVFLKALLQHGRLGVGVLLEEVLGPHPVHVVVVCGRVPARPEELR